MIGVVLVNYNGHFDTINCVKSLQASQGVDLPFIVVVDNDSQSKTIHRELSFYGNLKVVYNDKNLGFGKANNIGIEWLLENVKTDYIFLLNNDTIVYVDALCILKAALEGGSDSYGVATPRILFHHNPTLAWYDGGYLSKWRFGPVINNFNKEYDLKLKEKEVTFVSGCAMFFKTTILCNMKGFHPIFFMYEEDVEFSFRLLKANVKMLYSPAAVILHKEFGSQTDRPGRWLSAFDTNNINALKNFYVFNKNRLIVYLLHGKIFKDYKFILFFPLYISWHSLKFLLVGKFKILCIIPVIFINSFVELRNYERRKLD